MGATSGDFNRLPKAAKPEQIDMSIQVKQPDRLTLADTMAELDNLVPVADHCTIEMELLRYGGKWRIEWKAYTKQTGYSEEHQTLAGVLAELVAKLDAHRLTVEQAVEVAEGQVQPAVVGDPYGQPDLDKPVGAPCDNPQCDCAGGAQ